MQYVLRHIFNGLCWQICVANCFCADSCCFLARRDLEEETLETFFATYVCWAVNRLVVLGIMFFFFVCVFFGVFCLFVLWGFYELMSKLYHCNLFIFDMFIKCWKKEPQKATLLVGIISNVSPRTYSS